MILLFSKVLGYNTNSHVKKVNTLVFTESHDTYCFMAKNYLIYNHIIVNEMICSRLICLVSQYILMIMVTMELKFL